eukprot:SAG11_NODE_13303_length_661_cov_0.882562_1_plen_177_part_10
MADSVEPTKAATPSPHCPRKVQPAKRLAVRSATVHGTVGCVPKETEALPPLKFPSKTQCSARSSPPPSVSIALAPPALAALATKDEWVIAIESRSVGSTAMIAAPAFATLPSNRVLAGRGGKGATRGVSSAPAGRSAQRAAAHGTDWAVGGRRESHVYLTCPRVPTNYHTPLPTPVE